MSVGCRRARTVAVAGGIYVAVLGVATLVGVIGLAGILAARVHVRMVDQTVAAARADAGAQALVHIMLVRLAADPTWRTRYADGQWHDAGQLDGATLRCRLTNDAGGPMGDNASDAVTLHAWAALGDANRLYAVTLEPGDTTAGAQVILNGDIEAGLTQWTAGPNSDDADLDLSTDLRHGGARSIQVKNRDRSAGGPVQDLTARIEPGRAYTLSAWARMKDSTEPLHVVLDVTDAAGSRTLPVTGSPFSVSASGWKQCTGVVTPTWTGSLQRARPRFYTASTKQEFWIDDVALTAAASAEAPRVVPGTFRREWAPQ